MGEGSSCTTVPVDRGIGNIISIKMAMACAESEDRTRRLLLVSIATTTSFGGLSIPRDGSLDRSDPLFRGTPECITVFDLKNTWNSTTTEVHEDTRVSRKDTREWSTRAHGGVSRLTAARIRIRRRDQYSRYLNEPIPKESLQA